MNNVTRRALHGPADRIRVGYVQTEPRFADVTGNLERAAAGIRSVPEAEILVLPELFASGYAFRDRSELEALSESPDGPTVSALVAWARERNGWIIGGFPEAAAEGVYNSAALAGPDGTLHVYRKIHLFDRETEMFTPGDRPFRAWTLPTARGDVRVGVLVCFDWRFPEAARSLALDGAEVLLHPSNLVLRFCQDAMVTRCLENGVFSVTANRIGTDDRGAGLSIGFTGRSRIAGPEGAVLAEAPENRTHVAVVEIDLSQARDKRITPRNNLFHDRRPEFYKRLIPA